MADRLCGVCSFFPHTRSICTFTNHQTRVRAETVRHKSHFTYAKCSANWNRHTFNSPLATAHTHTLFFFFFFAIFAAIKHHSANPRNSELQFRNVLLMIVIKCELSQINQHKMFTQVAQYHIEVVICFALCIVAGGGGDHWDIFNVHSWRTCAK